MEGGEEWKGSAERKGSSREQFIWIGTGGEAAGSTRFEPSWVEELSGSLEGCSVTPTPSAKQSCGSESKEDKAVDADVGIRCPLQNSLILKHLFSLCPPSLLVKFRLVSKQWHEESLVPFRSSVWIEFNSSQCCFGYGFGRGKGKLEAFLQFVEDPRNKCDSKPFRRFRLVQWDFTDEECTHLIDRFWQACANSITHLKLKDCTFNGVEGFRNIIYNTCPNLQSLELRGYYNRTEDENSNSGELVQEQQDLAYLEHLNLKTLRVYMSWEPLPVAWLEFLSHFPKLQTLMLFPKPEMTKRDGDDVIVEMLRAVQAIRKKDKQKLTLKHLGILISSPYLSYDRVSPALAAILRQLQLPLESLTINFGKMSEPGIIKDILEVHAGTLKALNVQREDEARPFVGFPFGVPLDNLEALYLRNAKTFGENLNFLQAMPNLRKLDILGYGPELSRDCPNHFAPSPDCFAEISVLNLPLLTDLRINYADLSVEDVCCLVEWMPNVEKLTMLLGDDQFGIVCWGWKNLIHLKVLGDLLTDEGITGMKLDSEKGKTSPDFEKGRMGPTWPNITCLKSRFHSNKRFNCMTTKE